MDPIEQRTIAKVSARLVPFLMLCYFVAYLDRVNVGSAALTMNKALNISATAFGFGAGIFFFSYFVFEIPSNLALERFGARKWIARIMFTWGILSGAMAAVGGETSFYVVRVLLGAAEAGFFPGIIFYLTLWFPGVYRARIVGWFMAAIPLSSVLGYPVSAALLGMDGLGGLAGWQWLFIMEAAPAVILAGVVWFYLTDRPADAHWLTQEERTWLSNRLAAEARQKEEVHGLGVFQALVDPKVLTLALVYFGAVATNYGTAFWLPQIVKSFQMSNTASLFVSAIPYVVGTVGMIWWGRRSDAKMERKWHAAVAFLIAAIGIGGSTAFDDPTLKILFLSIGAFGVFAVLPVFWT
ncbi:MAG TPA: MFS transporter, partial [Rhodopila sp.]|nr:MFS transporter [Rhodopila sp.]